MISRHGLQAQAGAEDRSRESETRTGEQLTGSYFVTRSVICFWVLRLIGVDCFDGYHLLH